MRHIRQYNCRSFRCICSIAYRLCSNYIFILDLTPGFNGLGKNKYKTRREIFNSRIYSRDLTGELTGNSFFYTVNAWTGLVVVGYLSILPISASFLHCLWGNHTMAYGTYITWSHHWIMIQPQEKLSTVPPWESLMIYAICFDISDSFCQKMWVCQYSSLRNGHMVPCSLAGNTPIHKYGRRGSE